MSFSIIVEQQYLAFNIHYLFTTDKNSYVSTYLLTYLLTQRRRYYIYSKQVSE